MLAHPRNRAIAIEAREDRAHRITRNAVALGVPDLCVKICRAPEILSELPQPDAIFVGGGGKEVIDGAYRLLPRGRNLVANALRYAGNARVSLLRDKKSLTIRVEDDGPGIPENEIGIMMEPFRRGEASRSRETGDAGLGLTLARAIAEQHGGSVHLANRHRDDGSIAGLTADINLPLA